MSEEKMHRKMQETKEQISTMYEEVRKAEETLNKQRLQIDILRRKKYDAVLADIVGKYITINEGRSYIHVKSRRKRKNGYVYLCTTLVFGKGFKGTPFYEICANVEMNHFFQPKLISENRWNNEWNKAVEILNEG